MSQYEMPAPQPPASAPPPLFAHQESAVSFLIDRKGCGMIAHEPGLGKTRTAITAYKAFKESNLTLGLLVVAPLSLLEAAWHEDIKRFAPDLSFWNLHKNGLAGIPYANVYAVNYELFQRPEKVQALVAFMRQREFMAVLDECFSGETLIDTPSGKKFIKDLNVGDEMFNCLGIATIIGTKIKKLDSWIKIQYNGTYIRCSFNHPFLTSEGWKPAHLIRTGDKLVTTEFAMRLVQRKKCINSEEQILQHILLSEMENETTGDQEENIQRGNSKKNINIPQASIQNSRPNCREKQGAHKIVEPNFRSTYKKKNIHCIKKDELEATSKGWKWPSNDSTSVKTFKSIGKNVGSGTCHLIGKASSGISNLLQSGYRMARKNDSNRSRRLLSSFKKRTGLKKRQETKFFRVDDIKIYEQRNIGDERDCDKKDLFYDLKIKGHPSFSVNGAIVHNSSKIKNHASITTKHLLVVRAFFSHRIVMSGTPAPNDESEYWAQMEFVRPGILSKSFNQFRRTYFHLEGRNGVPINIQGMVMTRQVMQDLYQKQGAQFAITSDNRAKLFQVIGPMIHAAKKDECLDLPPQVDEVRLVQMGPRQRAAYNHMKRHLVAEIEGQDVVAQVALSKLMKLREITSGFAISENQEIVETECPKLIELEQILDELGDRQVIIWGNFTYEIEKIVSSIKKFWSVDEHGEPYSITATLYGNTKDREDSIKGFISGKYRYLVANPHSAAHGLTFVNCSHQIFFSLDYSWEAYEQARARTHRAGQKSTCVYYYILAEGTIDQEIMAVLKKKGDMQELVFKLRDKK